MYLKFLSLLLLFSAAPVFAHSQTVIDWSNWVAIPLLLVLLLYAKGAFSLRRRIKLSMHAVFAMGMLLLGIALIGPLENAAHYSLAAHMSQHMLLIVVVPPLLLLTRPLPVLLQALPARLRYKTAPFLALLYSGAARYAGSACLIHGLIIWGWHFPEPYQAAITTPWLHHLEHATFLFSALWFWWTLISPARLGQADFGTASVLALITLMHTGLLGALLTFAPVPLYPDHPTDFLHLGNLADQQLAGLIMWVPGGLVYLITTLVFWIYWLQRIEQKDKTAS